LNTEENKTDRDPHPSWLVFLMKRQTIDVAESEIT
jgi:hypothetical protein